MGKSGCMYAVGMLVWLINILAALHLGAIGLGYNIFNLEIFMITLNWLIVPIHYVIGASGLLSLFMFVQALQCKGASMCSCNDCGNGKGGDNPGRCDCGDKGCHCKKGSCHCGGGNAKCPKCGNDKAHCSCGGNSATKTM